MGNLRRARVRGGALWLTTCYLIAARIKSEQTLAPFHLLTPLQTARESVPESTSAHPQSISFRLINTD